MKKWMSAFRLRTLTLSLSSIFVGNTLGCLSFHNQNALSIFIFSVLATLCLQILSNLSNDLGDALKGVDNINRVGPKRAVQSGEISIRAMKRMIVVFVLLSVIFGTLLIYVSFSVVTSSDWWVFGCLGVLAVCAALLYTLGKRPYGYLGLGDFFVFLFFGLVGVLGTYYLHVHTLAWSVCLPAIAFGLLSTGVLNCNNVRDVENDKLFNKITIPVRIGHKASILYQYVLVVGAWICMLSYVLFFCNSFWFYIILLSLPLFVMHLYVFTHAKTSVAYDPELKRLSLSTFALAMLFVIGSILSCL